MKKHEKFAILEQYYDACHEEAKYRGALYGDEAHILLTNAKEDVRIIGLLVKLFYAVRGSCADADEMHDRMRDLRELAESDAEAERWTTGKALWKMFENWCIDDDEEGDEP